MLESRLLELLRACGLDPDQPWSALLLSTLFLPLPPDPRGRGWSPRLAALFPHVRFQRPKPADPIRITLQLLWLALARPRASGVDRPSRWQRWRKVFAAIHVRCQLTAKPQLRRALGRLAATRRRFLSGAGNFWRSIQADAAGSTPHSALLRYAAHGTAAVLALLCITTPFSPEGQALFLLLLWAVAILMRRVPGQTATLLLILLSITASTRYIWWRVFYTLDFHDEVDALWGLLLLGAELYAWLVLLLGYFQTARPLRRNPVPMPQDRSVWPSVDVYIPTYNEPLRVVKRTIIAAAGMDWPAGRLNVHVLDDGRREEFRRFAAEIGVGYIVRPDNRHAKAGNLNHALSRTSGDYVVIFDCDHVPTRGFLQSTMGWFLRDERLALVQTPHHFFSPDPFERNLGVFRTMPNEGELFHGLIQDGNDLWNAAFFCGSCAVLRRKPLEEVGGIAVETVTEDAHTALKLQRRGYTTALLNIPLAAGLATDSLSAHVGQRIRWARGMAQIFRLDNPFFGKGLNWAQRICYGSAMLHFFNGAPRLIFLTAPLAFLLFHAYVIHAAAIEVALYVLPHLIHAQIANSRLQGRHRRSFWAEVYETVLAWYIVRPTTVALLDPHKGKFNVTPKGDMRPASLFDWTISAPYLLLAALNLAGMCAGIGRIAWGPADEVQTAILNLCWTIYNLILLGAALAVAAESKQTRLSHRAPLHQPASVELPGGVRVRCRTENVSEGGVALLLPSMPRASGRDRATVTLQCEEETFEFPARVVAATGRRLRLCWEFDSPQQEAALIRCTLARSGAWAFWTHGRRRDALVASLFEVIRTGVEGYGRLAAHTASLTAPSTRPVAQRVSHLWRGMASLLPRSPQPYPVWLKDEDRRRPRADRPALQLLVDRARAHRPALQLLVDRARAAGSAHLAFAYSFLPGRPR